MRDLELRQQLAQRLRWLIGGRISNDAFEDFLFDEGCLGSADRTVDEIAWWAWTLYSDTQTYKLTGKRAVEREIREAAVRAIVLLRGGADYRWPTLQEPFMAFTLRAACTHWWLPTATFTMLALYNYGTTVRGVVLGPLFLIAAVFVAMVCRAGGAIANRRMQPLRDAFEAAGNVDCWPFLSREELVEGAKRGHLLDAPA